MLTQGYFGHYVVKQNPPRAALSFSLFSLSPPSSSIEILVKSSLIFIFFVSGPFYYLTSLLHSHSLSLSPPPLFCNYISSTPSYLHQQLRCLFNNSDMTAHRRNMHEMQQQEKRLGTQIYFQSICS